MCNHNIHYPIKLDYNAIPARYDKYGDPHPPEADWCCQFCGTIRMPYKEPLWEIWGFLYEHTIYGNWVDWKTKRKEQRVPKH